VLLPNFLATEFSGANFIYQSGSVDIHICPDHCVVLGIRNGGGNVVIDANAIARAMPSGLNFTAIVPVGRFPPMSDTMGTVTEFEHVQLGKQDREAMLKCLSVKPLLSPRKET
jgi:hypothetical protein